MTTDDREYLSLKVMRLSQPSWDPQLWPLVALNGINHEDGDSRLATAEESITTKWLEGAHALLLPITQGRVFSGEAFSAYINIANPSTTQAINVKLKVELLLGRSRSLLFDNSDDPIRSLDPDDSFDCTIVHHIQESGTCMLVCSISHYVASSTEPKSFKKSFKFTAQSPFKVTHSIMHLQDKAVVECVLHNVSQQFVFLNEASVLCSEGLECTRLDCAAPLSDSLCKGVFNFRPKDCFSVLFAICPATPQLRLEDITKASVLLQHLSSLGQLMLQWRTASGGVGTLSDYLLTNEPTPMQPLEVRLASFPPSVQVDCPFTIELEIINRMHTTSDLVLSVKFRELEPFVLEGPSQLALGCLGPQSSTKFTFEMQCLEPGFHSIRGIRVCDSKSQHSVGISPPCHILAF
ncbi:uncharacterized protein LOC34624130 [Cyclospora cayetanensis]|uniref:Uncharacterized protein LOC34624130 n=1 Tax=Cyclospora cayetanensis TaxID=88456 RepID=A0A6P6RVP2_9EIME|nr:uncharacterized protein LOC34624130 [Cyclospora cayetanensis]